MHKIHKIQLKQVWHTSKRINNLVIKINKSKYVGDEKIII